MLITRLKTTFADRCRKNPAYSLRAFSRSLGMDSSTVSALLSGKRPLSLKTARKIIDGLNITNPVEAQALLIETLAATSATAQLNFIELGLDQAEAISSWEHQAILCLLEIKGLDAKDRAIAERLGIPLGIVMECLARLEKLGLIGRNAKRLWQLNQTHLTTPSQIPSSALREGHRQNIMQALDSLENDPIDQRDISGITMAVAKKRLPEARKMIQEFRRKLMKLMEEDKLDSVYRLNIQLFPLLKEKK